MRERIDRPLRDDTETWCCAHILKGMQLILMKSPNNRVYEIPTGYLLLQNEASSTGIGLYSIELLAIEIPKQPRLRQWVALYNLSEALLLRTDNTHTIHLTWRS